MSPNESNKQGSFYFEYGIAGASKHDISDNIRNSEIKKDSCGDDSFAIAENKHQHVIAVADGVAESPGSWIFTNLLMQHIEKKVNEPSEVVDSAEEKFDSSVPVRDALRCAFQKVIEANAIREGSSTVCMISIDKITGMMEWGNLGDSGYIVIRNGNTIMRSIAQQVRFNVPYQIGIPPAENYNESHMEVSTFQLEEGDLVVLASDGMWDNLFKYDVLEVIKGGGDVKQMAKRLLEKTASNAKSTSCETPYVQEWRRYYGSRYGGKVDDTIIIVATVKRQN